MHWTTLALSVSLGASLASTAPALGASPLAATSPAAAASAVPSASPSASPNAACLRILHDFPPLVGLADRTSDLGVISKETTAPLGRELDDCNVEPYTNAGRGYALFEIAILYRKNTLVTARILNAAIVRLGRCAAEFAGTPAGDGCKVTLADAVRRMAEWNPPAANPSSSPAAP